MSYTKLNIAQGADGYVAFFTGEGIAGDNDLYWDRVNNRLGIHNSSPSKTLDVAGSINATAEISTNSIFSTQRDDPNNMLSFDPQGGTGARNWWIGATRSGSGICDAGQFFIWDQTGSVLRLTIDSSGNVGIGTADPKNRLDVEGSVAIGATYSGTSTAPTNGMIVEGTVGIGTSAPDTNNALQVVGNAGRVIIQTELTDNTTKYARIGGGHYDSDEEPIAGFMISGENGNNQINIGGGTSLYNAATTIKFLTAANSTTVTGSVRGVINSSGYWGIGTQSPTTEFVVNGRIRSTALGTTPTSGVGLELWNYAILAYDRDNSVYSQLILSSRTLNLKTQNASSLYINEENNVGIQTLLPHEALTVNGFISLQEQDNYDRTHDGYGSIWAKSDGKLYFTNDAGTDYDLTSAGGGGGDVSQTSGFTGADGYVAFFTGDGEIAGDNDLFYDRENNRLGIGHTNPGHILSIKTGTQYQGLNIENDSNTLAQLVGLTASNDDATLDLYSGGVGKIRLTASSSLPSYMNSGGNFGIGTDSPQNKLDVEGSVAIGATYSGTSSAPSNSLIVENYIGVGDDNPAHKLSITSSTQYQGINLDNGTNTVAQLVGFSGTNDTGGLDLYDGGVVKVRINASSGLVSYINSGANFGIGTTSPSEMLTVTGNVSIGGNIINDDLSETFAVIRQALDGYGGGGGGGLDETTFQENKAYWNNAIDTILKELDGYSGGGGDVTKVGTPVDNEIGVWTGDGTIEGDSDFTWDGETLVVQNESGSDVMQVKKAIATGTSRPIIKGSRSRGTLASPSDVSDGDSIFGILASAYNGDWQIPASIEFIVDGTPSTQTPGKIGFNVGTDSASRTEKMSLDSGGNLAVASSLEIGGVSATSALVATLGTPGATSIGGASINLGVYARVSSNRSGFVAHTTNDYLESANDNAHFLSVFPFADGSNSDDRTWKAFRGQAGVGSTTLSDYFWVNKYGEGYFKGGLSVGTDPGASAPTNMLDVEGAAAIGATYSGTSTAPTNGLIVEGKVGIGQTSVTSGYLEVPQSTTNSCVKIGSMEIQAYALSNTWIGENVYWNGSGFKHRATGTATMMYFYNAGVDFRYGTSQTAGSAFDNHNALRIHSDGNVGIGDNNPSEKLVVDGNVLIAGNIINDDLSETFAVIRQALDGYGGGGGDVSQTNGFTGADGYVAFFTGDGEIAGDNDLFYDRENNSLGIGTTSVATIQGTPAKLNVKSIGSGLPGIRMESQGSGTGFSYSITPGADDHFTLTRDHSGGTLDIMSWTYSGNIGIGTISPKNRLDVEGAVAIGSSYSGTSTAPTNGMIVEGDVGIGTNNPEATLNVIGDIRATNDIVVTDSGYGFQIVSPLSTIRYGLKYGSAGNVGDANVMMLTNREIGGAVAVATDDGTGGGAGETERIRISAGGDTLVGIGTSSPVETLTVNGFLSLQEQDNYDRTHDGYGSIWAKSDGKLYYTDDTGTDYDLTSAGGGGGDVTKVGTPADNQVAIWTGDGTIEGDSNFTWNGSRAIVESSANWNFAQFVVTREASNLTTTKLISYTLDGDDLASTDTYDYWNSILITTSNPTTSSTSSSSTDFGYRGPGDFFVGTGSTERFRILTGGNVGIGTTSPQNKLDVEGAVAIGATYSGTSTAPTNGLIVEGNVGIGTTSTTEKLEVAPDTDANAIIGRAFIGYGQYSNYAWFSHVDMSGSTNNYALLQRDVGDTYLNSPQQIAFRIANSDKMTLDSSGNFGIGTTSPQNKLDVEGAVAIGATYSGSSTAPTNGLIVEGNVGIGTDSSSAALTLYTGTASLTNLFKLGDSGGSGYLAAGADGVFITEDSGSKYIILKHNTGYVGIGTNSPSEMLSVTGSVSIGGNIINDDLSETFAVIRQALDGYGGGGGGLDETTFQENKAYWNNAIDTILKELDGYGSGSGDVTKVGTPANNEIGVWTGDGTIEGDSGFTWNGAQLYMAANGGVNYAYKELDAPTDEKIWKEQYANDGILRSFIANDADSASNIWMEVGRSGYTISHIEYKTGSGTTAFYIDSSQRVGIGRTPTTYALEVNGDAGKTSGGTSWQSISDATEKKEIIPLVDEDGYDADGYTALDRITLLRGVLYKWLEPENHGLPAEHDGYLQGLISQEVEEHFPEWVNTDAEGKKWLNMIGFEAYIIEALKTIKDDIEENKATLADHEARLSVLES